MDGAERKFWTPDQIRHDVFDDQVSKSTLLKLLRKKEIPSIRLGRRWYIPATWVDAQLEVGEIRK